MHQGLHLAPLEADMSLCISLSGYQNGLAELDCVRVTMSRGRHLSSSSLVERLSVWCRKGGT